MSILDKINSPEDIKALDEKELPPLCSDIREFLVDSLSRTGGHLASNLGMVELTVAIHRLFDTASDRLVFDVGHQCYTHKILTGRREGFKTLRKLGGMSGFPKPVESIHDAFIAGHASNSISVALGMARARTLENEDYNVIALIGDGALTGGLAYEALNDAGQSGEPLIVILNDNGMSITENVGGIARHLAHQRIKPSYYAFKKGYRKFCSMLPGGRHVYRFTHSIKTAVKEAILHCSMFEDMGFQYLGPVDGHDIPKLIQFLNWAKTAKKPVLLHVKTIKGKGYVFSELNPDEYHGVGCFDPKDGTLNESGANFSNKFGDTLLKLAEENGKICAITAAMRSGTGLDKFAEAYPSRFFDVGIAEGHAVSMAAGMAKQGLIPVVAIYSSFLQRSFDMLIHDVALQNLHVVMVVDRAGLVGEDGETHHGSFDIGYLTQIPNMTVLSPSNFAELSEMLRYAVYEAKGPVAVRYPRGGEGGYTECMGLLPAQIIRQGGDITLVSYGITINTALKTAEILEAGGISAEVIKLGVIKPIDFETIAASVKRTKRLAVIEECSLEGGVGQKIAALLAENGIIPEKLLLQNLGTGVAPHGDVRELRKLYGIDEESIAEKLRTCIHRH